jgi:tetratricopeptide (TPR) repeat protein
MYQQYSPCGRIPLTPFGEPRRWPRCRVFAIALVTVLLAASSLAQVSDYQAQRARALELYDQGKHLEALPLLEKLHEMNSNDVVIIERLAVSLVASVSTSTDEAIKSAALRRARALALRAVELGDDSNLIKTLLERIPENAGSAEPAFSKNKEVNDAMKAGESAFAKGDFDQAVASYQHALDLDPKHYEAALFIGDAYFNKKQIDKAGEGYAKAIAIDPDRETAYRYWADVLTKAGRLADARLKLIEAIIAEPYNRSVYQGLGQWALVASVRPGHPRIDVPEFKRDAKDKATIDISVTPSADGSSAWMFYSISRATWLDGKSFAKAYPNEKAYRHSLKEEAEALSLVVIGVGTKQKDGEIKALNPQLATLMKLSGAGLLEAYVLFARADKGIAEDYASYRSQHRDKLRQYLSEYFVPGSK